VAPQIPEFGQRLGHYCLLTKLGEGGMGLVFRAHDEHLDCDVALKVLPPSLLANESARKRFRKEALTLAKLKHPNIATVHDFDTNDGIDFLVMEFVDGVTLAERVIGGALAEKEILALGSEIAKTLEAAHRRGVVHRDLKPGNIMLTSHGDVKLLDFGLAKLLRVSESTASDSSTEIPGISGTMSYMAPEQMRGDAPDYRSDIYSLGAVLYELATGGRLFPEAQPAQLAHAVMERIPVSPSSANRQISAELERIILKCLEKEPENRYQSAKELQVDLRRLATGSSTKAGSVSRPAKTRLAMSKKLAISIATSLVLVGLLALFFVHQKFRKSAAIAQSDYLALTDFNDSAVAPALSPDGRMLAFVRNGSFGDSISRGGQIYVKMLPNGEPVPLTNDAFDKYFPVFSSDGTRIIYTVRDKSLWDSWQVSVLGGSSPKLFMANASGLIWVNDKQLLFSEIRQEETMGIVSAEEGRGGLRNIYLPAGVGSMAHRSALSPDHKLLLVVEMDGTGWLPCRLVPFDGSSAGKRVGPLQGQCTSAAWSPDGQWMYFSSNAGGSYHLWRQRSSSETPERITFGPTEEEGTGVTPDGKYLITSLGLRRASVWIHDADGDRQLTSQGFALLPSWASAGEKIFFLVRSGAAPAYVSGELWSLDLRTGETEAVLPEYAMSSYQVAPDGKRVLFVSTGNPAGDGLWIADLDRRTSPHQLTRAGEFRTFFGPPGEILYQSQGNQRHLYRMREDGSGQEQVTPEAITFLIGVSTDGEWAAVALPQASRTDGITVKLFPTRGGSPLVVCDACIPAFGPSQQQAPMFNWSVDGKYLYISLQYFGRHSRKSLVLPWRPGRSIEKLWPRGFTEKDFAALPGVEIIPEQNVFPGPEPSKYLFWKLTTQSNLYRIPVPN
jgi:eukaryotic-like serine/threonine-protein kinase